MKSRAMFLIAVLGLAAAGCREKTASEKAGDSMERAADRTGDAIEDAGDKAQDSMKK